MEFWWQEDLTTGSNGAWIQTCMERTRHQISNKLLQCPSSKLSEVCHIFRTNYLNPREHRTALQRAKAEAHEYRKILAQAKRDGQLLINYCVASGDIEMNRRYLGLPDESTRLWGEWKAVVFDNDVGDVEQCPLHTQRNAIARWFSPPGQLLFLGCGTGEELEAAQTLGFEAWGITLHNDSAAAGAQKGLSVVRGDAHFLPVDWRNRFDGVLSFHVVEHSPAPIILMRECHRVLKFGGRTYHEVPEETNGMDDGLLVHITVPTVIQGRALLLKSKFQHVESGYYNTAYDAKGVYFTGVK